MEKMNEQSRNGMEHQLFQSPEEQLQNVIEALTVALNAAKEAMLALAPMRVTRESRRCLQRHPLARKKVVVRFLAWCWNAEKKDGFFGVVPQTLKEEFQLYMVWFGKICPAEHRNMAAEINTFGEYIACREGVRKMWPEKWQELQVARRSLLGESPLS